MTGTNLCMHRRAVKMPWLVWPVIRPCDRLLGYHAHVNSTMHSPNSGEAFSAVAFIVFDCWYGRRLAVELHSNTCKLYCVCRKGVDRSRCCLINTFMQIMVMRALQAIIVFNFFLILFRNFIRTYIQDQS